MKRNQLNVNIARFTVASLLLVLQWLFTSPVSAVPLSVEIGLIAQAPEEHIPLSSLQRRFNDDGVEGAEQGISDNNTTGRFTGQLFTLHAIL